MKKIDQLILRTFIGPFFVTFFIALFVLLMQFMWKYVDDLVGKGLSLYVIGELILYMSATLVSLALPIAVLLSSIMTLGNLGENYELVALKSAGISLYRFVAPLAVAGVVISLIAFLFANYLAPVANLKSATLLYSVTKKRPALNIKPGEYYDGIDGYTIRVGGKEAGSRVVRDIRIHDHTQQFQGNSNVMLAEKGEMYTLPGDSILIFKLFNGIRYEEINNNRAQKRYEFQRTKFNEYDMTFDLSGFDFNRTDENLFKNNHRMLSVQQLLQSVDSMRHIKNKRLAAATSSLQNQFAFLKDSLFATKIPPKSAYVLSPTDTLMFSSNVCLSEHQQLALIRRALNDARNVKNYARVSISQDESDQTRIDKFLIEANSKVTLSLACLVLLLVGAPLGAIIRKGGLGMPMVVAIFFFVIFHILSTGGRKLAQAGTLSPFMGVWLPIFILGGIGLYLMINSANDSAMFNTDNYKQLWKKIAGIGRKNKVKE